MRFIKSGNKSNRKKIIAVGILSIVVALLTIKTLIKKEIPLTFWGNKNKLQTMDSDKVQGYRAVRKLRAGEAIKESDIEAVLCSREEKPASLGEILESKTRISLAPGLLLTQSNLSNKEKLADDIRIHNFPYIRLTNRMKKGDYIDVRISFSNGGDFVVLSKKKIEDLTFMDTEGTKANSLWLNITEEELLRLSSAVVDAYLNEGCQIYAIQYIDNSQKPAVINYSVSPFVHQLMRDNPNITKRAENVIEWKLWEEYKRKEEQQKKWLNPEGSLGKNENLIFEAYPEDNTKKVF